jgi:hypothetical protein
MLLGDSCVGKTVLFDYWCRGTCQKSVLNATVGIDSFDRSVMAKGKAIKMELF